LAELLNLVERLFAEVTERCVRRGSHTTVRALEKDRHAFLMKESRLIPENAAGMKRSADDHIGGASMLHAIHAKLKIDGCGSPKLLCRYNQVSHLSAEPRI
jgi:hypothetical protein